MQFKKHDRTYDIVVFGATGYTGQYLAEHIADSFPTTLKWALAGRSYDKLANMAAELRKLNPDRSQPDIETASTTDEDLDKLTKKTAVLITTVGPYGSLGEPAFQACAKNGTHYVDCTGEAPFTRRMIVKYEDVAKKSGAMMIPQCGIESAPADLCTWLAAKVNRSLLQAKTRDVTVAVALKSKPSGGTLLTVLTAFDNFSLRELISSTAPYALSPVPNPVPRRGSRPFLSHIFGFFTPPPALGKLVTTSLVEGSDGAIVERTWGLLSSLPGRKSEFYGPNFSFAEFMNVRSRSQGLIMHWAIGVAELFLALVPPLRWLAKRFVYQPGEGPARTAAEKDRVTYRAVATPDRDGVAHPQKQGYACLSFRGGLYALTGILLAEAARTMLEDDLNLGGGGIFTPACLGQGFVERLEKGGIGIETKVVDA